MRLGAAVLVLALAACTGRRTHVSEPIASATAQDPAEMKTVLKDSGVVTDEQAEAEEEKQPGNAEPVLEPADIDTQQRIVYHEFTVDMRDDASRRQVVKYLMAPDRYSLVACVQISPFEKRWKFMEVVDASDEKRPDLDVPLNLDNR